jgi:hypothetical protein
MATMPYQSYEEAAQDYLAKFRALREAPAPKAMTMRGYGEVPAETLVEYARQIADISAGMLPLAKDYLEAPDPALREGMSGQLLAQAAAELQVANELLKVAAGEPGSSKEGLAMSVAGGADLLDAIDGLEEAMAQPLSNGLIAPGMTFRAGIAAETPEEAKEALKGAVTATTGVISQKVVDVGGALAFDLVFNTQWTSVIESAGLMNKDVGKLLGSVKEGAGKLVTDAITAAARTIANAYDKILALVGKDMEDEARQKIQEWLENIKNEGKIALFGTLVAKLYRVDKIEQNLPGWLEKTTVDPDTISATTTTVSALADKFAVLVGRMNTVSDVIGLARFFQAGFPQVLLVITGIRIALLMALVYNGYDYIGYGQKPKRFLNITKGVAEVIRENLCV